MACKQEELFGELQSQSLATSSQVEGLWRCKHLSVEFALSFAGGFSFQASVCLLYCLSDTEFYTTTIQSVFKQKSNFSFAVFCRIHLGFIGRHSLFEKSFL